MRDAVGDLEVNDRLQPLLRCQRVLVEERLHGGATTSYLPELQHRATTTIIAPMDRGHAKEPTGRGVPDQDMLP